MPNTPLILAFDTSAAQCAAALLSGDQIIASVQKEMQRGQAETLLGLCGDMLNTANVRFQDLTAIGVGIGPGNFTGIRISVSAARGLALGLDIPAIGVNAFDALRFGVDAPCACTVAAPREQVYFQSFTSDAASDPILADATSLPAHDGPLLGDLGQSPKFATAEATALCCLDRLGHQNPRPTPMYIRPADAAPARDAPPVMLS